MRRRRVAAPFVVAAPGGARIRARLRLGATDAQVLRLVGEHLGSLAGLDLAVRCRLGLGGAQGGGDQRAERKRALTAAASSRWAGAITRCANDQWRRGRRNLLDARDGLRHACRTIRSRLAVPAGGRVGRVRGYGSRLERFQKQSRLQRLEARLAKVEERIVTGRVSVCRGGRRLAKLRHALDRDDVGLTEAAWRTRWQAERWFLTADGEAGKSWGNETIRIHPDEGWLELRLPTPLGYLSNTRGRAPTYRLGCPVTFSYRAAEWAAQAASGAVAYTIWLDPGRGRWYLDASWRLPPRPMPALEVLRQHPAVAVDLNAGHLAGWVLNPAGNPLGPPHTIGLDLDGQPAGTRDGRLRAAVATVVGLAKAADAGSIVVEDLDFADARHTGRETMGRGKRGRRFRRTVAGIPTRAFRDLLVGMAANAGLWVVAVDPAYTSVWGGRYWQAPLNEQTKVPVMVSRHHAAAVVIGRRGLGYRARRRGRCAQIRPEDRIWRAADSAGQPGAPDVPGGAPGVVPRPAAQGPGGPGGQRAGPPPAAHKTRPPEPDTTSDQVAQDRSVPPEDAGYHPLPP
jgi:IS605 OrfB family transposase